MIIVYDIIIASENFYILFDDNIMIGFHYILIIIWINSLCLFFKSNLIIILVFWSNEIFNNIVSNKQRTSLKYIKYEIWLWKITVLFYSKLSIIMKKVTHLIIIIIILKKNQNAI